MLLQWIIHIDLHDAQSIIFISLSLSLSFHIIVVVHKVPKWRVLAKGTAF